MRNDDFETFYDQLLARHRTPATHVLSTAGDAVILGAIVVGLVTRRGALGMGGAVAGLSIAAAAHLFQPGTLGEELREIGLHPLWALRAESRRVRSISPITS
jgi:hypothetical protein